MSHDECARVGLLELDEEGTEGGFLFGSACVGCFAIGIKTAFVAYSDRVLIVNEAMGSYHGFGTSSFYGTVSADNIVVALLFAIYEYKQNHISI